MEKLSKVTKRMRNRYSGDPELLDLLENLRLEISRREVTLSLVRMELKSGTTESALELLDRQHEVKVSWWKRLFSIRS